MIGAPSLPDLSVLVVDESVYTRRIVRDVLQRTGIRRVYEAPDGAEALGVLVDIRPDLIILDWDLAILTGEEVIRMVRDVGTSPVPSVPMILMLSQPRKDRVERAVRLGINEVIAKPFSPKTMWSRLDEVINRPRPYTQVRNLLLPRQRIPSMSLLGNREAG